MTQHSPVFILGVPRSGTSALQLGLLQHGGYSGQGEGHVVPLLGRLFETTDRYWQSNPASTIPGNTLHELGRDALRASAREALRSLYQHQFGGRPFCDKTPGVQTIRLATELQTIWPEARFIYCQRRGLDNVASKLRKFPQESFRVHCKEWADTVKDWHALRHRLAHRLELDQLEMLLAPGRTAQRIGVHLGLDADRVAALASGLKATDVERTAADPRRVPSLAELGWSEADVATFRSTCGETMELCGYTYDDRYWRRPLPSDDAR